MDAISSTAASLPSPVVFTCTVTDEYNLMMRNMRCYDLSHVYKPIRSGEEDSLTLNERYRDEADAQTVQKIFTNPNFRVYTNTDRRGVELGGAVKNVIALAVGMALGLDYGDNAKAALITRGNAELARLGVAMGCQASTFAGLSGMGDLIVTCTSMHSRNLHAGMLMGRGLSADEAKKEVGQVVEGINALPAARKLARQYQVEMPIVEAVHGIVSGTLSARNAVAALMGRGLKRE